MAYKFLDRVRMAVSGTPGTGVVTLGSAVAGFQSLTAAGASDGDTFPYLIIDGVNWEFGVGTYAASGTTLTRTTISASSNGGSAVSFTATAVVTCTLRAEDMPPTQGTPPTVVQFNYASAQGAVVPVGMTAAPTNGNILVAFVCCVDNLSAGSGWTLVSQQTAGLWYLNILTKTAGASESSSQSPIAGTTTNYWTAGVYEVAGASGVIMARSSYAAGQSLSGQSPSIPKQASTLALMCIVPASSQGYTITATIGWAHLSANLTGVAGGHMAFGWSDSNTPVYGVAASFSNSCFWDEGMVILTH